MTAAGGIFTVSLDFELYWGVRDKMSLADYESNLQGVRTAVRELLSLFGKYEIHAAWAVVGFIFARNLNELKEISSTIDRPDYELKKLNPYEYIDHLAEGDEEYHFAPDLIEEIKKTRFQELASHTFSHYYCLEEGQTRDQFRADVRAAVGVAAARGLTLKSFVFPRNQSNDDYLEILKEYGIEAYRGNERGWLYKAANENDNNLVRRALRLVDAYLNLSGPNLTGLDQVASTRPGNVRSSRFLRPVSRKLKILENLRLKRILGGLEQAAKGGKIYHLWWHPHNFGVDTGENLEFLEKILLFYENLKLEYGMKSLSLGEISRLATGSLG